MLQYLASQFGRPRGVVGHIVGWLMATRNGERTRWTVGLLDVQPRDRVLEIGFGPGLGIELCAALAVAGRVAGVDHSAAMVADASRRNLAAIRAGRVELRQGSVMSLPYHADQFDKAFAINSLRFWPAPVENLREVRRILQADGRLAITEQPIGADGEAQVPRVREQLLEQLAAAGFREVRIEALPTRAATCLCALGIK
jgi:SAM-dependent methyltransferase